MSMKRPPHSVILLIVLMLVASGSIRLGSVGWALAKGVAEPSETKELMTKATCHADDAVDNLVGQLTRQIDMLEEREFKVAAREKALEQSKSLIAENLERLEEAEKRLSATVEQVDGAAESDLDRLTSVYETMKPKTAAAVFEQMSPEFAAGFLGRMAPASAAEVFSSLSSEKAYAISVVLAGRNANAPRE